MTRSALLLIDIQQSFAVDKARWEKRDNSAFERNVRALLDAYRARGAEVVFVMHTDDDEGFKPGDPDFKLMSFLDRREREPLFIKRTRNCFTSTELQRWLIERGIESVTIAGLKTEECCETSARVACDLGFKVNFVTEATLTFPIEHPDKPGETLAPKEIRERTEYALRGRFARIATVAEIVAGLA